MKTTCWVVGGYVGDCYNRKISVVNTIDLFSLPLNDLNGLIIWVYLN